MQTLFVIQNDHQLNRKMINNNTYCCIMPTIVNNFCQLPERLTVTCVPNCHKTIRVALSLIILLLHYEINKKVSFYTLKFILQKNKIFFIKIIKT